MKQLAKFKEDRELQIHLHKIIKIQSLIRGALVRLRKIPNKRYTKNAAQTVAENFIQKYIDHTFIPDLLLEIVTQNKITEDFGLYSLHTQALMQVRHKMMAQVVKVEIESVGKELIARFIDLYF